MNRRPKRAVRAEGSDSGRAILEALVGLTLLALAIASWGRIVVADARTGATVAHRGVALDIAGSELERLTVRDWDELAVDPSGPGARTRFEGAPVVLDPTGVSAETVVTVGGDPYTVLRLVIDEGDPSWRRLVVVVDWVEGNTPHHVRLDGAALQPPEAEGS